MKKTLTILFLFCILQLTFAATTIISTTSAFTFTPPDVTINSGDTIQFNVGGGHTSTEVSLATWNANDVTSNGGWNFSAGTNSLTGLTVGTHYYVCHST